MKKIKMVIYGEPGVGKSVFACKAPKPFFICTDPNYEWLEDFGAKPEDHVQIFSWEQAKKEFGRDFSKYETIVIDLTEDLFKWCEYEWCNKNGLVHVGDLGYGKGYDITRNEFFIEISKLLNLDKNVILIMHGLLYTVKDRRGVEYTKYAPSNRIPDKVIDMIEGRVRYFVRAFARTEEDADGNLTTSRYLSLSPDGTTEFGITRGLTGDIPRYIPLDWNAFYEVVSKNSGVAAASTPAKIVDVEPEVPAAIKRRGVPKKVKEPEKEVSELASIANTVAPEEEPKEELDTPPFDEDLPVEPAKAEAPAPAPVKEEPVSNTDKIAAIKAKLAALKNK